jgi:TIR domain-containing protein
MPKIAISYRRKDSDAITGRIRDRIARQFGDNSVFMDIDNIPLGIDFRKQIQEVLRENQILLVIIGPNWTGPVQGARARIFDLTDPVRIEVEAALQRGIPTIPVLVGGATMPSASELPESLKDLPFYNAAEVSSGVDFHPHVDRLIRAMEKIFKGRSSFEFEAPTAPATNPASLMRRPGLRWAMISGVAVTVAAAIAYKVATLPQQPASVSVTATRGAQMQSVPPAPVAPPAAVASPTPSQPGAPANSGAKADKTLSTTDLLGRWCGDISAYTFIQDQLTVTFFDNKPQKILRIKTINVGDGWINVIWDDGSHTMFEAFTSNSMVQKAGDNPDKEPQRKYHRC